MPNLDSKKDFLEFRNKVLPKFKNKKISKNFSGQSSGVFIGEYGYPKVNVGILSSDTYDKHDESKTWVKEDWGISKIASKRLDLVNSHKKSEVKVDSEYVNEVSEVALSKKIVDVEVGLEKEPGRKVFGGTHFKPIGISGEMSKFDLVGGVKIPTYVEKVVGDTDLKANEGLLKVYSKGFDENYLTQVLSSGSLGLSENRKLVPTKWSITATDDMIGKELIRGLRDRDSCGNLAFRGEYLGNYFLVLVFDGPFSYELFEFFRDSESITTDYEGIDGRKNYAFETAGGYYAARNGVLEKFSSMKRQGQALVLRFITDEYYMPLGVWVVREAVRKAMDGKGLEFGSPELMIEFAKKFSLKKFGRDVSWLGNKSKLLEARKQKRLDGIF